MGIEDLVGKAKDALAEHADQIGDAIDSVAEKVKEHTGDDVDAKIDSFVDRAKDLVDGDTA